MLLGPLRCAAAANAAPAAPTLVPVRAAATAAAPAPAPRPLPASSYDARRMRLRAHSRPYEDPTGDRIFFPRQHLGNNYILNWSLNKINVTPTGDAYRNLPARQLVQFGSDLRLDNFHAVHTQSAAAGAASELHAKVGELGRHVRQQLTDAKTLFVHDGALGAHPRVEVRVRAVTDDAATALWLQHMLPRVSMSDPFEFEQAITVFASSQLDAAVNDGKPFVAVDATAGHIVLGGRPGLSTLQNALVQCAAAKWAAAGYQLVSGDTALDASGVSVLLLGAPDALLDKGLVKPAGAHHHLLGSSGAGTSGLYRVWAGVTHPTLRHFTTLQRYDLVERVGGAASSASAAAKTRSVGAAASRLTTPLRAAPNACPPLAHAVVVVSDDAAKKPAAKASDAAALTKLLLSADGKSYNSALFRPLPATAPVETYAQLLQQGLLDANAKCHVVSAAPSASEEQLQAVIKQILRL